MLVNHNSCFTRLVMSWPNLTQKPKNSSHEFDTHTATLLLKGFKDLFDRYNTSSTPGCRLMAQNSVQLVLHMLTFPSLGYTVLSVLQALVLQSIKGWCEDAPCTLQDARIEVMKSSPDCATIDARVRAALTTWVATLQRCLKRDTSLPP